MSHTAKVLIIIIVILIPIDITLFIIAQIKGMRAEKKRKEENKDLNDF